MSKFVLLLHRALSAIIEYRDCLLDNSGNLGPCFLKLNRSIDGVTGIEKYGSYNCHSEETFLRSFFDASWRKVIKERRLSSST